jgi:predicted TPR repeat methyltransferase
MDRSELQARLAAAQRQESESPAAAEAALRDMLAEHPAEPLVLVRLARLLHRVGRVGEAIPLMLQAAQIEPTPAVFNDLGSLHLAAGDSASAIDAYEAALRLDSKYLLARSNLADVLLETGRIHEAIDSYREVLARDPTSVDAQVGLAIAALRSGQIAVAISACEAALAVQPGHIPALHAMAIALGNAGDKTSAIATERQALTVNPQFAKGWHALGNLLDETGDVTRAAQAYERALELEPGLVEVSFDLAALSGESPPRSMPRPYVTRLFDDFAATFERRLVAELDYRVPEALRQAVAAELGEFGTARRPGTAPRPYPTDDEKSLDILDLGCGTGLVGKQFRDLARRMTGVDLSTAMLAAARAAGIYDELVCNDVVDYMRAVDSRPPAESFGRAGCSHSRSKQSSNCIGFCAARGAMPTRANTLARWPSDMGSRSATRNARRSAAEKRARSRAKSSCCEPATKTEIARPSTSLATCVRHNSHSSEGAQSRPPGAKTQFRANKACEIPIVS